MDSKFKTFIKTQLKEAGIGDDYVEKLTQPEPLKTFKRAFIDVSWDPNHPDENYEELEFIGDGYVKAINSQYIPKRFKEELKGFKSKKGTSEGAYSKTRRLFEQTKFLYPIGVKKGFWEWVKADEETKTQKRNKTLENVVEAFIGALAETIDANIRSGLGYFYAKQWLETQLNEMDIKLTEETLNDSITRINELYKTNVMKSGKAPLKWGNPIFDSVQLVLPIVKGLGVVDQNQVEKYDLVYVADQGVYGFNGTEWQPINDLDLKYSQSQGADELAQLFKDLIGILQKNNVSASLKVRTELNTEINKLQKLMPKRDLGNLNYHPCRYLTDEYNEVLAEYPEQVMKEKIKDYFQTLWWMGLQGNPETKEIIGWSVAFTKSKAKMTAAEEALKKLKNEGYY